MNVFLKVFCDYGTNPVKSMIWSFYVMLGFGLFYFFFPQHTGMRRRRSLQAQLHNYAKVAYRGQAMALTIHENHHDEENYVDQERAEFMQFLKDHQEKITALFCGWEAGAGQRRWVASCPAFRRRLLRAFDHSLGTLRDQGMRFKRRWQLLPSPF